MYEDDWLIEFSNRATPGLRELFERELDGIPAPMCDLLAQLGQSERTKLGGG